MAYSICVPFIVLFIALKRSRLVLSDCTEPLEPAGKVLFAHSATSVSLSVEALVNSCDGTGERWTTEAVSRLARTRLAPTCVHVSTLA